MDRRRSSHIVSEIYDATIDPGHWDYVVTMIAKFTRSDFACLYHQNKDVDYFNTIAQYESPNCDRINFESMIDNFNALVTSTNKKKTQSSRCIQFNPETHEAIGTETDFYISWMNPNGIYHVGGAQFLDNETHKAGVILLRHQTSGTWEAGDIRVIDDLLPHLKRAFNIHSEFTHMRVKHDALSKGLDRLVIGLILYNKLAKPVYFNPTAKSIIATHPALDLKDGDLYLTNNEDKVTLRDAINHAAQIDPDDSWKQSVALGIRHPDTEAPLPILVTPMHAGLITSDMDYEGAKVAVILSDPNLQHPISVESLVSVYNLTPSESQVAISLVNGHSIDEIALLSHHSAHTIRTQLKSVFRKMHVSSQSELVKLILSGPFAMRRRSLEHGIVDSGVVGGAA